MAVTNEALFAEREARLIATAEPEPRCFGIVMEQLRATCGMVVRMPDVICDAASAASARTSLSLLRDLASEAMEAAEREVG